MTDGSIRFKQLFAVKKNSAPVVTAWKHFIEAENNSANLAEALIAFQKKYQWDFVKINPSATYYAEGFGNKYDFDAYSDVLPKLLDYPIKNSRDLDFFAANCELDFEPFEAQIDTAKRVRAGLGDTIPIIQTLFSPLCILTFLAGHNPYPGAVPPSEGKRSRLLLLLEENPVGAHKALEMITAVLLEYVDLILDAEIDGFFYSIFGHGNTNELSQKKYQKFSQPYDKKIFEAIHKKNGVVMLHTCGPFSHPEYFAALPNVDIIHWADHDEGNPSLRQDEWLEGKIPAGGVDQRLFSTGAVAEIADQARAAIHERKSAPFVLTAGCGLPVNTTEAALWALRKSVEENP